MNLFDKISNKIGYILLNSKIPILILIGIYLIEKNHLYMNKKYINYFNIFKKLKFGSTVLITGTGVLIIFFKDKIIKFPMGEHSMLSLSKEYNNYLLLKRSSLKNLVEYNLKKENTYYVMEYLFDCKAVVDAKTKICSQLSKYNSSLVSVTQLISSEIFTNAFNYIKYINKGKDIDVNEILTILKSKVSIPSCAMHGDLTPFNIMQNFKGNVVLIDLDRFEFNGIEKIDRIHFCIEYYAKRKKKDFFLIIDYILRNKNISNKYFYFLFLYFIYRIGVECNLNIELPIEYKNKILTTLKIFLIKIKEIKNAHTHNSIRNIYDQ